MDDKRVTAVEAQNDQFRQAALQVETESKFSRGVVVLEVGGIDVMPGCVEAVGFVDSVPEGGFVCFHPTRVQARIACRIASDLETCSCSARAVSAFNKASSMRTGTTVAGPSPIVGRPRLRRAATS